MLTVPNAGPIKLAIACTETADPDVLRSQMSTKEPAETATAGPPNIPENILQITNVWIFCARAAPIVKSRKIGRLTKYTIFLPKTSDNGALNIGLRKLSIRGTTHYIY